MMAITVLRYICRVSCCVVFVEQHGSIIAVFTFCGAARLATYATWPSLMNTFLFRFRIAVDGR